MSAIYRGVSHFYHNRSLHTCIKRVVVYKGHERHPLFGPYPDNIEKRIQMFHCLNAYRKAVGINSWEVIAVPGENLKQTLKNGRYEETLLVIPPGQSSRLDAVFSQEEVDFLKKDFFAAGGLGYLTCGASYWASKERVYHDLCETHDQLRQTIRKTSKISLFPGIAEGPLCPFPGNKYQVGFYSDAVRLTDSKEECTVFLSGGGSFFLPHHKTDQKIAVLARYLTSELVRLGKRVDECQKWQNAAVMVSIGKGTAVLSMFHPYYGSKDIDYERYERAFPNSGTNWKRVHEKLSPTDVRMRFMLNIILKLESRNFDVTF